MLDAMAIGYGLITVGVIMFILEALIPGFFIAVPATILVILGACALLVPDFNIFSVYAPLIALVVGVPATGVALYIYRRIAPPDRGPSTRSSDSLVGLEGIVTVPVTPQTARGKVRIEQQSWSAICRGTHTIPVHMHVRVVAVEGVILVVESTAT